MELYEKVKKQVENSSITYNILRFDKTITVEDIVHDVYLKIYENKTEYIHRKIKQYLIDIYRSKKSHKIESCPIVDDILIDETIQNGTYFVDECLKILNNFDPSLKQYVYDYFVKKMTYREMAQKYNISYVTAKNKVDKSLKILRKYYKDK